MSKPAERDLLAYKTAIDNARKRRILADYPPDFMEYEIEEIVAAIATAREEGRREAIEECANLVNPGDWPTQIHRECAEEINDAIRALTEKEPK